MKKKISIYAMVLAGALSFSSCADDFLDQKNTYQLDPKEYFTSEDALRSTTLPLYNYVWYSFNDKFSYGMGDGRANNITAQYSKYIYPYTNFTDTPLSEGLPEAWESFHSVISQSNNAIENIQEYSTSAISEETKQKYIAEARFMRGLAYWYVGTLWGCGIIYTNTTDMINNYVVPAQPGVDVIEFAIRDLEYAAKYLPSSQSDAGRVTKYSAFAALSRVYLSMAGLTTSGQYDGTNIATDFNRQTRNTYYLDLAKKAALKVINESDAKLAETYAELFAAKTINNNEESLFQLQFIQGTAVSGAAQSMTRFLAWSTTVADTNAWGGSTYCSYDLWEEFKEYEDETLGTTVDDKTRRHYCVASYGESYPELSADAAKPYVYGVTENPGNQGANIKKYVIGTKKVNGFSEVNNSGINTYMIRLAEVYLNYIDAVLGNDETTTDATALDLLNKIRTRAGVAEKNSINYEDLRHEYRLELAFEGLYWYFLVRHAYTDQQNIINYLNNQHRNASYYDTDTKTYKLSDTWSYPGPSVTEADASKLVLPISSVDQGKNPNLKPGSDGKVQTVSYTFGEREVDESTLFD